MPIHALNAIPPVVQVGLSVGVSYRLRNLDSPPTDGYALIDTGASMTAITPAIVAKLRPQQVGTEPYTRPDQPPIIRPTYSILLCFEPDLADPDWMAHAQWFGVVAVEAKIATPGVDVLVGQDLLGELALSWDGPRGRLLLMY